MPQLWCPSTQLSAIPVAGTEAPVNSTHAAASARVHTRPNRSGAPEQTKPDQPGMKVALGLVADSTENVAGWLIRLDRKAARPIRATAPSNGNVVPRGTWR